jgi:predicted PurR-regulated permease PerM
VICICVLIAATFWILRPFIPAMIWAATIVITTWPAMLALQAKFGGRRFLATTVMTVALLLVLVLPLTIAIATIVGHGDEIVAWTKGLSTLELPRPPDWVATVPAVGERINREWNDLATAGPGALGARIAPYVGTGMRWLFSQLGNMGLVVVEFLMTVIIAAIFYTSGEAMAAWMRGFARRLAGEAGDGVLVLSMQSIRAVALGIVVTAVAQSVLGGIGLAVAGVPFAGVLTAVMFVLGIAQIGAGPVLLGAVAWLYWKGDPAWATGLLVWSVLCMSLDNVLRPVLIRRGANLPLILIFGGVIGGLLAFGVIGLFIGPLVLAVVHTLLTAWINEGELPRAASEPALSDGEQADHRDDDRNRGNKRHHDRKRPQQ